MICAHCGNDNLPGKKFCGDCGTALAMRCPKCGADTPGDKKFCGDCGAQLQAPGVRGHEATEHSPAGLDANLHVDGERRQLTVLFCDLVGSTEIAARTDPEEWRTVLVEYHRAAREVIARFGGHAAKNLGDGVLAYFGWPSAHEDDAERAVRAGLAIIEGVKALGVTGLGDQNPTLPPNPIAPDRLFVRVGVDTGQVVIADAGEVYGDTANIAARVQALAAPDSVLVTAATHRLISGLFIVEARGPQTLKGVTAPIDLYRIVQPSGVRGRLAAAAAAARTLTPFVGRDDERRLLRNRFAQACDGAGQVVLIVGEAGIGKSRLAQTLHDDLADVPHTWLEAGGQPYFVDTPFYAITELLKQFFAWRAEESDAARAEALARAVAAAGLDPHTALPLVAPLLELPLPPEYPPVLAAPEVTRKRLLATLAAWALGNARLQPLVILLEDLHWVDSSTVELQHVLADQSATAPLLLLYTSRPEFRAPWPLHSHHTQITLSRLAATHTRTLVQAVAARAALPDDMLEAVIARTDGVPLFAEELTKAAVEMGAEAGAAIPATLADSLMARLDRLGPHAKEVAQIGAVVGREFSYTLLAAVAAGPRASALSDADLETALGHLVNAELLYVRGVPPDAVYSFKHALVQDAAYGSLLVARRRAVHGQVAHLLSTNLPQIADNQPELLAHHYTQAGETALAIDAWHRAAERALRAGAARATEAAARHGLRLLDALPTGSTRDQREFHLQLFLNQALTLTKGYASPEKDRPLARVRELASRVDRTSELNLHVIMLWVAVINRDGPLIAQPLADEALAAAEGAGPWPQMWAHFTQATTSFYLGRLRAACEHAARALSFYGETARAPHDTIDGRVAAVTYAALAEVLSGYADRGRRLMDDLLAHAGTTGRPMDRSWAEVYAAGICALLRDHDAVTSHVARALQACGEETNAASEAAANIFGGWVMATQGGDDAGIDRIRSGLNALASAGTRLAFESHLGWLSEALTHVGRFDDALRVLADAEGACPGEEVDRAETIRRRAELLSQTGAAEAEIEQTFQSSLDWARRQDAKLYELRAAIAYARWLRDHNRGIEAHALLAPIYAWFTEGFDTRDLIEAKSLLDEL
jgi:class 3 adenylate cyclase